MKTLIILLVATCSLNAADVRIVGPDVRIVGKTQIDLAPIHQWIDGGRKGDRPMPHWKYVAIESLQLTAPWATCYVQIDRKEHKTIYLNNVPKDIVQYLKEVGPLESQIKTLSDEIASDKKRLREAELVDAQYRSEYAVNRRKFRDILDKKQGDLDALKDQLKDLKSKEKISNADLAMFTGQIYNKLEVWDFGMKQ